MLPLILPSKAPVIVEEFKANLNGEGVTYVKNKKKKVLVVDDDPLVLLAVSGMLKQLNCEVLTADNGAVALNEITKRNSITNMDNIDIIVMDANMPVMNGYESSSNITQLMRDGLIKHVNIVCLSAQESGEHEELCKISGMDYISMYLFIYFV